MGIKNVLAPILGTQHEDEGLARALQADLNSVAPRGQLPGSKRRCHLPH